MRCYLLVISDSRDMSEVENNSVDFIVTSPPYWHLETFSEKGEKGWESDLSRIESKNEFFEELTKVWRECKRVLKPGGYLVSEWEDYPVGSRVYGYPREIFLTGDMVKSIEVAGFMLISRWIWKKFMSGTSLVKFKYAMYDNLRQADPRAVANWAYVFAFKKRGYLKRSRKLDFSSEDWKNWLDGVWYIEAGTPDTGEAISGGAVFPEELIRRLIKIYTLRGDMVLDPFLGTGTTMKVAFDLGRSCIGYECLSKMLPVIKTKVRWGSLTLDEEISWELIEK